MQSMNISLPDPLKQYVDGQISTGRYSSASEYVRDELVFGHVVAARLRVARDFGRVGGLCAGPCARHRDSLSRPRDRVEGVPGVAATLRPSGLSAHDPGSKRGRHCEPVKVKSPLRSGLSSFAPSTPSPRRARSSPRAMTRNQKHQPASNDPRKTAIGPTPPKSASIALPTRTKIAVP